MGLLDDLKKQSSERERREEALRDEADTTERRQAVIETRVRELRAYLVDLAQNLNYLHLEVQAEYEIPGYKRKLGPMRQSEYMVSELDDGEFSLTFRCEGDHPHRFKVRDGAPVQKMRQFLLDHGLPFECTESKNARHEVVSAVFEVQERLNCRLRFRPNARQEAVDMMQRHYAGLTQESYTFPVDGIDDAFKDDLGNYIVRKPNTLLDRRVELMTDDMRAALRQRLARERERRAREEAKLGLSPREPQDKPAGRGLLGRLKGR